MVLGSFSAFGQNLGRMGFVYGGGPREPSATELAADERKLAQVALGGYRTRVVGDRVYDALLDPAWETLPKGTDLLIVSRVTTNGVICDFKEFDFVAGVAVHKRFVVLRNCPNADHGVAGEPLPAVRAVKVDRVNLYGETCPVYDCGIPYQALSPKQLTAEERATAANAAAKKKAIAATASFRFYEEKAQAGDPDAQFKLGKKYLAGDGVETNAVKAREMFVKAAAQGNEDARAELGKMAGGK
jgi:hypothetical protein